MDKSAETTSMLRPARIITLGCRLNQADSALLTDRLRQHGYFLQKDDDRSVPELIIINSCAVTAAAAAKSRQAARRMQSLYPAARIVFTGCAAEVDTDNIRQENWLKLGNTQKRTLMELLAANQTPAIKRSREAVPENFAEKAHGLFPHRTRAFIKIQEGCDNFCTYCIVPYTRGPSRSRQFSEVIADCRQAIEAGAPEIILTGVNTCNYCDDNKNLCDVITTLCETIPGKWRLRLSSTEPALDNLMLLETMARYPEKVCRFLHLALQHGSDSVLKRMNRHYTTADFARFVQTARQLIPNIHLGTDIIAGFPGESDEEFAESLEFARQMNFANMHVFSYSKRAGTPAAAMPGQVPEAIKKLRHQQLEALNIQQKNAFAESMRNQIVPVIFETIDRHNQAHGWSDNYIAVTRPANEVTLSQIIDVKF
ncbi:MAG: tRNA (N(6)-L-threonylcarbamoyladenosine(37)-C(2))-methylthiotransferase MtaB [Lentisphaerae bacterium]|nr:tRNA (N(6)-L-threonylcarbamoyladenosine(37)-C(2))-methylthiotransferase MtaB [Lentisphaerota bacterium]